MEISTLVQYYHYYAKEVLGYNSWNHLCSDYTEQEKDNLKKDLKREFKARILNKERQQRWRAEQKEKHKCFGTKSPSGK